MCLGRFCICVNYSLFRHGSAFSQIQLKHVCDFIYRHSGLKAGHPLLIVLHIDETQAILKKGPIFFSDMLAALFSVMVNGSPNDEPEMLYVVLQ